MRVLTNIKFILFISNCNLENKSLSVTNNFNTLTLQINFYTVTYVGQIDFI